MRFLLDTHTFMWWNGEPEKIPTNTLTLLQDPAHELLISICSLWEMQIKIQLGKLSLQEDLELIIRKEQELNNLILIPITLPHVLRLKTLTPHHKDPFDRLLIAQSLVENATLVSRDAIFQSYDCWVIW